MTLYVNQRAFVNFLGAAPPYGAGILAGAAQPMPFGAKRGIFGYDLWLPTTETFVAAPLRFNIALLPPTPAVANIQVYQMFVTTSPITLAVPEGIASYVVWAALVAPADPVFVSVSWEIWSS